MLTSSWTQRQAYYLRNTSVYYWLGSTGPAVLLYWVISKENFGFFDNWLICVVLVATISTVWRRAAYSRLLNKHISWFLYNSLNVYILAVQSSLWAYISFYVFSHAEIQDQAVICMMVTGISAGSIPVNASSKLISGLTIPMMLLPLSMGAFSTSSHFGSVIGIGCLLYLFILLRTSKIFHNTLKNEYELALRNDDLRVQLEEKAARLVSQAQHSSLGNMAGNMAHEINNPLTTLIANMDLLKLRLNMDFHKDQIDTIIEKISSNIERMTRIMKSLKHFSNNDSLHEWTEEKINSIFSRTALLCQERLDAEGINLIIRGGPYTLTAECRASEICHALLNLINNSREAVAKQSEKWIRIEAQKVDDTVEIRITDSGVGIKNELHNKIMEPFFTTKDVGQNVGLGLSVAAAIIKSHHGSLRLDTNSPNTSFVIHLPLKIKSQNTWNQII